MWVPSCSSSKLVRRSDANVDHVKFYFDAVQKNVQDGSETEVDNFWSEIRLVQKEAFDESLANDGVPELN